MRSRRLLAWSVLVALSSLDAAPARQPPQGASWSPEHPVQGTLVLLRIRADSLAARAAGQGTPSGEAAGEPLHFGTGSDGAYWAVAPIPLRARDTLIMHVVVLGTDGSSDTVAVAVPIALRIVDTERIRMPAAFGRPIDSALAGRIAAEREAMRGVARRSHDTPRLWREGFLRPVSGRVTEGFGVWRAWSGAVESRHDGVDLAGASGTAVRAANRGVVARVADQYYGGLTVQIDHGAGLVTSYQHLSRVAVGVAVGDTIARGALIGRVGATGRVTGPHLHWGASYGAVAVDPLALLELAPPP